MKKLLTLILALAMALSLVACGSSDKKDDSGEKTYTVGVVQLVQHEALDAATKGFTDALKEALGDKVNVVVKNASGDSNTCGTIVNGFLADIPGRFVHHFFDFVVCFSQAIAINGLD